MYKIFGVNVDKKILFLSLLWSGVSFFMSAAYAGVYGFSGSSPSFGVQTLQFILFLPVSLANIIFSPISQLSLYIPLLNSIWLTNTLALADLLMGLVYGALIISIGYFITQVILRSIIKVIKK